MTALDPAALAKIEGLALRARAVVEGALAGMHRSPHRGQSVEFAEHKEYAPGDEIRHVDWKAVARADRYYVKRFEQETDLRAYLCVDASGSMGYRSERAPLSKLGYAATLAAAIAHLLLMQQDQVALLAFGEGAPAYLPPRAHGGHLAEVVAALEALRAGGATDLRAVAEAIAERAKRRSLVIVLSDLLDFREGAFDGLRHLRAARHDVAVLQVLDPDELTLPFSEPTLFLGMEDRRELLCDPGAARGEYLAALGAFLDGARASLTAGDAEYRLVDISRPPADVLVEFLAGRQRARARA